MKNFTVAVPIVIAPNSQVWAKQLTCPHPAIMRKPILSDDIFAERKFRGVKNLQNFIDNFSQMTSNNVFREN